MSYFAWIGSGSGPVEVAIWSVVWVGVFFYLPAFLLSYISLLIIRSLILKFASSRIKLWLKLDEKYFVMTQSLLLPLLVAGSYLLADSLINNQPTGDPLNIGYVAVIVVPLFLLIFQAVGRCLQSKANSTPDSKSEH